MKKILFLIIAFSAIACTDKKKLIAESVNEFSNLELGTVEYTVSKAVPADKGMTFKDKDISIGDKKILYSMTATLKAGLDLSEFNPDEGIIVKGKDVILNFPASKVLVLNIAPSSIKYEFSKVSWYRSNFSEQDRSNILKSGEQGILEAVPGMGILAEAEKNSTDYFTVLLKNMGFKNITINYLAEK